MPSRSSTALVHRPLLALCLIAALIAALAGCGGESKSGGSLDPAALTPASASAYLGLTVRPSGETKDDAQRISRTLFGTDAPGQAILDLAAKATGQSALSFEQDVDPWLGDRAGVALLPTDSGETDIVLIAASRDDDKAQEALEDSGRLPEEASFRDADYRKSADGALAGAVFEGAVVLGRERAVQGVINSVRDDSVLSEAARYTTAIGELPKDASVATAYLDVGAIAELLGGLLGGGATAQLIEPVLSAQGDAIAASVIPEQDGLRIEAVGTGTGSGIAAVQARGGAAQGDHDGARRRLAGARDQRRRRHDRDARRGGLVGRRAAGGRRQRADRADRVLARAEAAGRHPRLDGRRRPLRARHRRRAGSAARSSCRARIRRRRGAQCASCARPPAACRRAPRRARSRRPGIDEGALLTLGSLRLQLAAAGDRFVIAIGPGALAKALQPRRAARRQREVPGRAGAPRRRPEGRALRGPAAARRPARALRRRPGRRAAGRRAADACRSWSRAARRTATPRACGSFAGVPAG